MGDSLTYSVLINNLGPDPATGIGLTFALSTPDDPTAVNLTSDPSYNLGTCTYDGKKVSTCTLPDLAQGANETLTITGNLLTASQLVATATVSSNELVSDISTQYSLSAGQTLQPPSTTVSGGNNTQSSTPTSGGGGGAIGAPLLVLLLFTALVRTSYRLRVEA